MAFASSVLSLCRPRFQAGRLAMTTRVVALVHQGHLDLSTYLTRHLNGDWGDISHQDWRTNQFALRDGERLRSSYRVSQDLQFCLITESDRSVTRALLAEEGAESD